MTKHIFKVAQRKTTGRAVKKLRAANLIPANVFGKNQKSLNIEFPAKEFILLRREVGESSLIYLSVEGEKEERPVIVREVNLHPVTGQILHVSFNQVSLKEKVTAPVSIEITGEAQAVKEGLGILVQQLQEVEIEALPTDIPESIIVDVSGLATVDSAILVKDLSLDRSKVTITSDPEAIVAKIQPLAAEEKEETPAPVEGESAPTAEGETPAPAAEPAPEPPKE